MIMTATEEARYGSESGQREDKAKRYDGSSQADSFLWPMILIFSRLIFACVLQLLVAIPYIRLGYPHPVEFAGRWFTVYGTLIDVGCLLLISVLIRKENRSLIDLVNAKGQSFRQTLWTSLGYIALFFPLSMLGMSGSTFLLFGTWIPQEIMGGIPLWAAVYSVTAWPLIWASSEQITYQGYALPKLIPLVHQKWMAFALVSFGWAIQHVALPLHMDWRYMAMRTLSFIPVAIAMTCMYSRSKRLLPFIIAHWVMDLAAAVSGTLLPFLR